MRGFLWTVLCKKKTFSRKNFLLNFCYESMNINLLTMSLNCLNTGKDFHASYLKFFICKGQTHRWSGSAETFSKVFKLRDHRLIVKEMKSVTS